MEVYIEEGLRAHIHVSHNARGPDTVGKQTVTHFLLPLSRVSICFKTAFRKFCGTQEEVTDMLACMYVPH